MTQATDRSSSNSSKGFAQSSSSKPSGQPSSGDDRAFRAQVAAEIAQLRTQVDQAVKGQTAGLDAIATEYEQSTQPLVDEASELLYDMLSGRSLFTQIGRNVEALMSAHPTGEKPLMGKPTLRRLSFEPLKPATQQSYLGSADDVTEQ